jgi:hypothetical protein
MPMLLSKYTRLGNFGPLVKFLNRFCVLHDLFQN